MWSRIVARHCVTCVGCTPYSLANCETVLSPTRASNPTLALKAALCRLRFAFIVCFLFSSRPAKVHLNKWSSFWGPPQFNQQSNLTDEDGKQMRLLPFFDEPFVTNGRLLKISWDLRQMKCNRIEWVDGLEISHARFIGAPSDICLENLGALPLPRLVWLS